MLGIAASFLKQPNRWFGLLWCLIGLSWIFKHRSYQKHGYLQIEDAHIQINYTGLRGQEKILKQDIKEIVFKPRLYTLHLVNGRKKRIYKGNLAKQSVPILEEVLNSINKANLPEKEDLQTTSS